MLSLKKRLLPFSILYFKAYRKYLTNVYAIKCQGLLITALLNASAKQRYSVQYVRKGGEKKERKLKTI